MISGGYSFLKEETLRSLRTVVTSENSRTEKSWTALSIRKLARWIFAIPITAAYQLGVHKLFLSVAITIALEKCVENFHDAN